MATEAEFLLALAQGLTGVLAIAATVLAFLSARLRRRKVVGDVRYEQTLLAIALTSAVTIVVDVACWAAWARASPQFDLLLGLSVDFWLALVFGTIGMTSAGAGVGGAIAWRRASRATARAGWTP